MSLGMRESSLANEYFRGMSAGGLHCFSCAVGRELRLMQGVQGHRVIGRVELGAAEAACSVGVWVAGMVVFLRRWHLPVYRPPIEQDRGSRS